ncbi:hypothetical protein HYE82_03690 [Streptomyces sp. BR123]|uniref:hypothetical protein n=1 Tax=Streptomyces sp. BR123 TaxID=2749828 RepID=UPI0015C4B81B|nr:hypothetical protein [Streptomyces sp. BR123]NXY93525.1 hypothetical protein [Streptomyces sp. BR123]
MAKTWTTRRRGDERDFLRSLRKGMTVYVINEPAHIVPGVYRPRTYSSHTVTGKNWITGGWEIGNNNSAAGFLRFWGTVYDQPPAGFDHISYDEGDVRYDGYGLHPEKAFDRKLDAAELDYLDVEARYASERRALDKKAGRRGHH